MEVTKTCHSEKGRNSTYTHSIEKLSNKNKNYNQNGNLNLEENKNYNQEKQKELHEFTRKRKT